VNAALSAAMTVLGIALIRALIWLLAKVLPDTRWKVFLFKERHLFGSRR
jgi:hypothetical protein